MARGTDTSPDGFHVILCAVVCIEDLGREAWWAVLDTAFLVQGEAFLTHCGRRREGWVSVDCGLWSPGIYHLSIVTPALGGPFNPRGGLWDTVHCSPPPTPHSSHY
jgi:hypothetical protein